MGDDADHQEHGCGGEQTGVVLDGAHDEEHEADEDRGDGRDQHGLRECRGGVPVEHGYQSSGRCAGLADRDAGGLGALLWLAVGVDVPFHFEFEFAFDAPAAAGYIFGLELDLEGVREL